MKQISIKKDKFSIINFIGLFVAGFINAVGAILFLFPLKIYDSGVSGLSMFLDQLTPSFLNVSIFLIIINFPIFLFGLKKQGVIFTVYSLFAIAIYSLTAFLFKEFILNKMETLSSPIVGDEIILATVFGGVISGIGSGLTIRFGGAMDGLDVLSVIFAKKLNLSIGTFTLIFNTILYIVCGITFKSWNLPLFSIIAYFLGSKTIDFIVDGLSSNKCAVIITNKAEEISHELSNEFKTSGTIVNAIGAYSKENKSILYFNVNRFQINKLKKIVLSIDQKAYITLQEVSDIIRAK